MEKVKQALDKIEYIGGNAESLGDIEKKDIAKHLHKVPQKYKYSVTKKCTQT